MIVKDAKGNELLEVIDVPEERAEKMYNPVNHCLAVVKVGNEYLMGWNHWRKDWEIFGGCKEDGEDAILEDKKQSVRILYHKYNDKFIFRCYSKFRKKKRTQSPERKT